MHAILSLDLGIKNIGYTIISYNDINDITLDNIKVDFDILDITNSLPKRMNVVVGRCHVLHTFFINICERFAIDHIIIERQVSKNVMAMELMYAISAISLFYCNSIIIFDPKDKFNKLDISYSTISKKHKQQSITYARNLIKNKFNDMLIKFDDYKKQDDISDSLNQCFVWLLDNNYIKISKDDFKQLIIS